jgi:nucleotide-binding universal stress UspA family protein
MKILLGVDTSPHSCETVSFLCGMKCPKGTSVTVVSAVAPTEPEYGPMPHVQASVAGALEVIEAAQLETHEALVAKTEETLRKAGFETAVRVIHGDPRRVLVETARTEGVQLIVIGSHGHSGLGRLFLGSVASYVVSHAPCNVMVVRRDYPEAWS